MKLNIGCGANKLEGFVNIDCDPSVHPDLWFNLTTGPLPFKDGEVSEILCSHTIEHVAREFHPFVIAQFNRVLTIGGHLYISYPEFEVCANNFMGNIQGQREYWEQTILGRGSNIADCHRALMITKEFIIFLRQYGFGKVRAATESGQAHSTFIDAVKTFSVIEMPDLLRKELSL